jgi:hypothetical protein
MPGLKANDVLWSQLKAAPKLQTDLGDHSSKSFSKLLFQMAM